MCGFLLSKRDLGSPPFCVSHPANRTIIWGPCLMAEAHLTGLACSFRQTRRKKVATAGGEIFREPNGRLSLGLKVKASICSKKLVYFLRTGRPPAPPGPIQPTLHILLLWELKINRYALKNTQTHLPSTPLPESLTARDANLSGSETQMHATSSSGFNHRLRWLRKPPPLGPTPHTHLLQPLGGGADSAGPGTCSALDPSPRPEGLLQRSPGHQAHERPLPTQRAPILPAPRLSASVCKVALSLPATHPRGLWLCFLFPTRH